MTVRQGNRTFSANWKNEKEATILLPDDLDLDVYDVIAIAPNGTESRLPNALLVVDPDIEAIRSQNSFGRIVRQSYRVPNDGVISTTLWVRKTHEEFLTLTKSPQICEALVELP